MSKTLRICGAQMCVTRSVPANEAGILASIDHAAKEGADFLLTPEGALSGYYSGFDREEVAEALERVTASARAARVGLALGTCYKSIADGQELCHNQVRVYTPAGDYLGFHSKILRCSPLTQPGGGEVLEYAESPLRVFLWNGICFGILICNDLWATPGCTTIPNPYLAWQLKLMGAQLILHSVNSGTVQFYRHYHESNVEMWARTLKIHIAGANAAGRGAEAVNCRSGLVGPDGTRLISSPDVGEHFFTCEISIDS